MLHPHPLEVLYRAHYGFVWHAVRRFGVAAPLTDDAVQDTFITAYRRFDELAMPTAKSWLYGIARRVASNYRRADLRGARKRRALAVAVDAAPPSPPSPEALLVLERFLDALDPVDRELFVLSEIEGMTGPEAAEILALNTSTTYSRVQSLRRRFRESIADRDPASVVHEAREQRPRATTHGWLALAPQLGLGVAKATATGLGAATFAKAAAIACGVTVVIGAAGAFAGATGPRAPMHVQADVVPLDAAPQDHAVAPAAALPPVTPPSIAIPTPPTPPVATPSRSPSPTERSPAAETPETPPSLEHDHALLREASDLLRAGDATGALATIERHARELPKSALADARTALRIEALCALGDAAQARGEAHTLLVARPATPVRGRIERSCVGASVDPRGSGQQGDR